ncbi:MAG TPA: hypothetical protein VF290_22215 [Pyrinomonadaceae bacterium]
MSNWTASNYRRNKAARRDQLPAQWMTNPETGVSFFIRPVNPAAMALAGYLPGILKNTAVEAWKKHGIEPESDSESVIDSAEEQAVAEETARNNRVNARLIYEACLIPTLIAIGEDPESVKERALKNCELAFAEDQEWKSADADQKLQRAADVVLPMEDLDESDTKFILSNSYSYGTAVPLKGGRVMNITDLKSLHKKPGRRARTGTGG